MKGFIVRAVNTAYEATVTRVTVVHNKLEVYIKKGEHNMEVIKVHNTNTHFNL